MSVPATIEEFCQRHGLSECLPMLRENEVDLDVVRELSRQVCFRDSDATPSTRFLPWTHKVVDGRVLLRTGGR